jgi:hypothetical protein
MEKFNHLIWSKGVDQAFWVLLLFFSFIFLFLSSVFLSFWDINNWILVLKGMWTFPFDFVV